MDDRFPKSPLVARPFVFDALAQHLPTQSRKASPALALAASVLLAGFFPAVAHATDGCLLLLCLAAPSWSNIAQCVDPVRSALDDLAHGRPFPSCDMAGAGNGAGNRAADAPSYCPPQYTTTNYLESSTSYECAYVGAIEVDVNGALWTRTWWSTDGSNVTEYAPAAKAQLGTWDPRFDDDYAAWLAVQTPSPVVPVSPAN